MKKFFFYFISSIFFSSTPLLAADAAVADSGNTAWLLLSSALVMLMTPGLAFFYAGMVNRKNVVSTLLQNYVSLAIVGILWVTVGYSLVFSEGNAFIGGTEFFMLNGITTELYGDAKVPHLAFMVFQMMFAVITPALITGAIAERVNFAAWVLLLALWTVCVYFPVAHWVWGPGGWIAVDGGLDFAGGLVVHITAGVAGLVAALTFGRRFNAGELNQPSDISMIMLGAALLWFGWFGFNAGSAISSGVLAAHAFVTTFIGASVAFIAWMALDWIKRGKPSAVGAAIGLVVGLVAITPAAGYVSVEASMVIGGVAALVCHLCAEFLKKHSHLDDALDVFACHGIGGIVGAILTGVFASKAVNPAIGLEGWAISGSPDLFVANITGAAAVVAYTAATTWLLIKLVNAITPIRVSEEAETKGLDVAVHGEILRYYNTKAQATKTLFLE